MTMTGGGHEGGGETMMLQSMGASGSMHSSGYGDVEDGSMTQWLADTSDVGFTAIGGTGTGGGYTATGANALTKTGAARVRGVVVEC